MRTPVLSISNTLLAFGTLPVVWCLLLEIAVLIGVSLATSPPDAEAVAKFDEPYARVEMEPAESLS